MVRGFGPLLLLGLFCVDTASGSNASSSNASSTTALATTALATTTPAAVLPKPVYTSLYISGMDYGLLQARAAIRSMVITAISAGAAYGQSFSESDVSVELSSGSTIAVLQIAIPAGSTAAQLAQQLTSNNVAMAERILQLLQEVFGVNSVLTGVLNVQVCGLGQERGAVYGSCTAFGVVPAPAAPPAVPIAAPDSRGSLPFDLNAASLDESSKDLGQWAKFITVSIIGLVASAAGVMFFAAIHRPEQVLQAELLVEFEE